MKLPKDPPKRGGKQRCSVTGRTSISELTRCYGLKTQQHLKKTSISLSKADMIAMIIEHEGRSTYKGNNEHDLWRSARREALLLLSVQGSEPSLLSLVSKCHIRKLPCLSRDVLIRSILCYECSEHRRQACFRTFWQDRKRMPEKDCIDEIEAIYATYLDMFLAWTVCRIQRKVGTDR